MRNRPLDSDKVASLVKQWSEGGTIQRTKWENAVIATVPEEHVAMLIDAIKVSDDMLNFGRHTGLELSE